MANEQLQTAHVVHCWVAPVDIDGQQTVPCGSNTRLSALNADSSPAAVLNISQ